MKDKKYWVEKWKRMMCGKGIIDICFEEPHRYGCNGCGYFYDSEMLEDDNE